MHINMKHNNNNIKTFEDITYHPKLEEEHLEAVKTFYAYVVEFCS